MRILIACEESAVVREAFKKKGHDVWSCDLLPSRVNGRHYKCDIRYVLPLQWDMLIAFPPCTYLTTTGNKWMKPEYASRFPDRPAQRQAAVGFFMLLANANIERIAIENPVGIMSSLWRKPNQIVHPYFFGEPQKKATCLWLKNLPLLKPTNMVEPEKIKFSDGNYAKWHVETSKLPPHLRSRERSKTFQGLADAMSEQWGCL